MGNKGIWPVGERMKPAARNNEHRLGKTEPTA